MSLLTSELAQWRRKPVRELLAGAVATFALIPEVIAFSFVAGVDPQVGLYASFVISIVIAFAGGRPAMISAAAGSVALVAAPLVATHGLNYLLAAGVLAGLIQIVFGLLRLGVLMRFVSSSVRTGFVNALAILIFSAQLPQLAGATPATWVMLALGLAIIYGLPRVPLPGLQAIPSPLICIVALTLLTAWLGLPLKTVADLGQLPSSLPGWHGIVVPLDMDTLRIIAGPAIAIAMVGLLESMMTARVVDELTDSPSSKSRECAGLGLANIGASLFGGIAGCGMIGQTVGNVKYGGRGRLSTLFAGVFLLVLMVLLKPWVSQVPVVALVAIMVMVSASTFDWGSLRKLVTHPRLSTLVMIATVVATLVSHDLSIGVGLGVLLSALFFAWKAAAALHVAHVPKPGVDGAVLHVYRVRGQVFFASADAFVDAFDPREVEGAQVRIDVSSARFWDITALAALDKVRERFAHYGCTVNVVGLQSRELLNGGLEDPVG
ncbi:sulfate permease, SulP family [Pseudoxanthomonas sp. GM95]|uniref:SulP family inorganic anion transporter n=1 Tax=Pseudoxanthomonas sp. GM95 TaxID=1881043 RepID=UPI0008CF7043|nr:SulP family inorganic anion transporter [Pseudoxanthomonas sp. GM95]SEM10195.1 sulfate permease, SulP family [Pseudoxanthomonas sp. GM95]